MGPVTVLIFPQIFFLMARLTSSKVEEIMILANCRPGGGGGGYSDISYIRRLWLFLGFKILSFNIFGGFQKNEYFWGIKIL